MPNTSAVGVIVGSAIKLVGLFLPKEGRLSDGGFLKVILSHAIYGYGISPVQR